MPAFDSVKDGEPSTSKLNRQQRRYIERGIKALAKRDHCSIYREPFAHNSRSWGGLDESGTVILTCAGCADQLAYIHVTGLVLHRNYDFFNDNKKTARKGDGDFDLDAALEDARDLVNTADEQVDRVARFGGVSSPFPNVNILDAPWKDDDRAWFKQHSDRSHRIRLPFPGEVTKKIDVPEGHELYLLIRQIEPGNRLKCSGFLNKEVLPLPDVEALAHVLFDIFVSNNGGTDGPVSSAQVRALVERYLAGGRA
jgi:hypothetical protein